MLRTLIDEVERVAGAVKVRVATSPGRACRPNSRLPRASPPAVPPSTHETVPLVGVQAARSPPRGKNDRPTPRRWCVEAWRR